MLGAADFLGNWSFERRIEDRAAGQVVQAEGQVSFAEGPEGLIYHERGVMRLPGQPPLQAERRYLWRLGPEGVEVRFDDGRAFHGFRPEGLAAGTEHPCGADIYNVTYDFTGFPEWRAVWIVSGPRKDYTMETGYARLR